MQIPERSVGTSVSQPTDMEARVGTGVALLAQGAGRRADGDVVTFLEALHDAVEAMERIRDERSRINTDDAWACGWCGSNVPIDSQADIQHSDDCPVRISILALANLRSSEPLASDDETRSRCMTAARVTGLAGIQPMRPLVNAILAELDTLIGKAVGR